MSNTPRTDASAFWVTSPTDPEMQEEVVVSHFSRQLERELSKALEQLRLANIDACLAEAEAGDLRAGHALSSGVQERVAARVKYRGNDE